MQGFSEDAERSIKEPPRILKMWLIIEVQLENDEGVALAHKSTHYRLLLASSSF